MRGDIMALCTKTGLVMNDEDVQDYDPDKAIAENPDLVPAKGKAKKPDGTIIDLPKKVKV